MSAEKTLELLKKLKEDPKAKELLDGLKNTASADDVISCYAQIAAKLGYDITAEEIREVVNQEEARRKSETEKATSDIQALNDDEVENVVGGVYWYEASESTRPNGLAIRYFRNEGCRWDFTDDDCTWFDACEKVSTIYFGCTGKYYDVPEHP